MAHSDRDPRWQSPQPDAFFMKRIKIEDNVVNPLLKIVEGKELAPLEVLMPQLEPLVKSLLEKFEGRNVDVEKEIQKEVESVQAKMTSETIHEGFSKTVCFC
jgi:hypothetical protein